MTRFVAHYMYGDEPSSAPQSMSSSPAHAPASGCSLRAKLVGLVVTLGALTAATQAWLSRQAPVTPAQQAVHDADLFPKGSGPQRASIRCLGCPAWPLEPGENPALYASYSDLPRVTLNADGTPSPEAVEALKSAWKASTPLVLENYVPASYLAAWELDNTVDPTNSQVPSPYTSFSVQYMVLLHAKLHHLHTFDMSGAAWQSDG